MYKMIYFC